MIGKMVDEGADLNYATPDFSSPVWTIIGADNCDLAATLFKSDAFMNQEAADFVEKSKPADDSNCPEVVSQYKADVEKKSQENPETKKETDAEEQQDDEKKSTETEEKPKEEEAVKDEEKADEKADDEKQED